MTGTEDDLRIYNYPRSRKQIIEDMNAGHPAGGSPIGSQTIYWKFDEQQGSTANNAVEEPGTGSLDGTVTGADWRLPENNCKVNGCLTFSSATDDVSAGDTPFTDSLTAMTISLWVSPTTLATSKGIVSKSNFGAGSSFAITTAATNTEIQVFVASSTSSDENYFTTSDFSLTTSTFSHLAMVYDGSLAAADRVKVYKDGRGVSGTVTNTIPTSLVGSSTANLTAGESGSTSYQALNAHLDEVKIYAFALSASEVLVDMNAGSAAAFGGVLGVPGGTPHDNEGFGGDPPVGWWKMDENTGTTSTADSSGNGYTGTLTNMTPSSWVQGKFGSALDFKVPSTQYVSIPTGVSIANDSTYTVAGWFKDEAGYSGEGHIYSESSTTDDDPFVIFQMDNNAVAGDFQWSHQGNTSGDRVDLDATNLNDNRWHHVAAVRSASDSFQLYIDGILRDSEGRSVATSTIDNITLGVRNWLTGGLFNYYQGAIDDVRVYNYAVSAAQVQYLYNRGGPAAWYRFDECQGATAFDSSVRGGYSSIDTSGGKSGNITVGTAGTNTSHGACNSGTGTEAWNNGTTGKMNASLDFDGTDDVVTVASESQIDLSSGLGRGFTIGAWINADSAGESNVGEIFDKGASTYCRTDNPSGTNLDVECALNLTTDATVNISAAITTGTWNHVAVTWTNDSDDEITVWVNGQNVGSSTNGVLTTGSADGNALSIGGSSAANFDGRIDDFRIYLYEMSAGQMRRLYNEGAAVRFGPSTGSP